ncbi:amino acid permease [Desulfosediminicola flagellatus]|uniref:amino acid permease n=1 Tax=Desulfosediminicola flagellatus TaxID=2569541 RepID=UPI0010AD4953|nr:amino acid permease [Desulfosediminicola flagellatus]
MGSEAHSAKQGGTLGTFAGVFTPSILTILGIILFLRLGYVVGSAGLMYTLVIVAIANVISVLTSFSLAAIATNLKVKGGGDYYLISRTLGLEYGGALGLVLFLAQSVSIAFYSIGFGEAVSAFFPGSSAILPQLIAGVAVCFLFALAWFGSDLATKFQYLVMTFLVLALFSFYVGGFEHWDGNQLIQNWNRPEDGPPFWVLFAIFFPAVTGFTQGVSMSGDLKNPGKSLPTGTFMAVGLSILVYFSVAVIFAGGKPLEILRTDYGAMGEISRWGYLIDAGVIAATLSSAMASFLGAPRILQSLATDKIFSFLNPFAHGAGPLNNPRRGVLLSAVIAAITIALGQLDMIARLVSMFFLISYGLLNYATYFEAKAASPSFRPRFQWYHPNLSLIGFLACLGVMLAIDLTTGVVAISIIFAIHQYLKRTTRPARWADSQRSHRLQRVRSDLLSAGSEADHPRDWRPYILAFSNDAERRETLLKFASWLEGGSGITTVVRFLAGDGLRMRHLRRKAAEELEQEIQLHRNDVFSRVISGTDPNVSLENMIQSFGLGPIKANTILVNWLSEDVDAEQRRVLRYGKYLRTANRMGCHIVILSMSEKSWAKMTSTPPEERRIDVWWRGDAASRLMLLLAYLITRDEEWSDAHIRVLATNYPDASIENSAILKEVLEETRISAEPLLFPDAVAQTVIETSQDAALTFMPFDLKHSMPADMFGNNVEDLLQDLGVVALVQAGQEVDLGAEPEEGAAGILANALDALEQANKRTEKAIENAEKAALHASEKMNEIEISGGTFDDAILTKLKAALKAREKAEAAAKKVVREQAKTEEAEKDLESQGGLADKKPE